MSIVSSTYTVDAHQQPDGRRYVVEQHTGSDGVVYQQVYLADVAADHDAILAAHAATLVERLADAEADRELSA